MICVICVGCGIKIDNQVQVGYNCIIGEDVMLCGFVGIVGLVWIGNCVVLGGQVGVLDNIFVGDDVIVGGVIKIFINVLVGCVLLGSLVVKMEMQVEVQKNICRLFWFYVQVVEFCEIVKKLMEKCVGDDFDWV